jgi:hypothetical protein
MITFEQGKTLQGQTTFGNLSEENLKRMKEFWDARGILQRYPMM